MSRRTSGAKTKTTIAYPNNGSGTGETNQRSVPWKYIVFILVSVLFSVCTILQSSVESEMTSFQLSDYSSMPAAVIQIPNNSTANNGKQFSSIPAVPILIHKTKNSSSLSYSKVAFNSSYPQHIFVDEAPPHYRPLINRFLLGNYSNTKLRVSAHDTDAVIMATAPDATLASSVHNLYHLLGFRRFIFVVNNATLHCSLIFDLVPQHNPRRPHVCLDHVSFYSPDQLQKIQHGYPKIHRGDPKKTSRGDQWVHVPRMGWYLQQFSKLLISDLVPDLSKHYLAVDGDLIFTRPFEFVSAEGKVVMPKTEKPPRQWRHFVNLISKDSNTSNKKSNYVVGWMVLDRMIVQDLIATINQNLPTGEDDDDDDILFPFNVLKEAEKVIDDSHYFSEFYVYARFALNHVSNPYSKVKMPEPARNPGRFHSTCILSKTTYQKAQNDLSLAPFLIWEEHKQHSFQACPNGESSPEMRNLWNVGIWHDFHAPPWGGGNQFLLALRHGLEAMSVTVVAKSDKDGKKRIQNSSQVMLANSITFRGKTGVLDQLKKDSKLALVHRVDGPYYVARYFQSLQNITITTPPKLPEEDKKTKQINQKYACATVFQSEWILQANFQLGLTLRNPVVIPNTIDPTIFYAAAASSRRPIMEQGRKIKIKIVASSHSNNVRKGFDTMMWLDSHLDFSRFEFVYMGGVPKSGFQPRNLQVLKPGNSESVAAFLRSGDIYLAPSRYEPASNAVMEALSCGLPVLYQEGSSHGNLAGDAGLGFASTDELLPALERLVENYDRHVQKIHVPSIEVVSKEYLSIMRWCFYMKHLML